MRRRFWLAMLCLFTISLQATAQSADGGSCVIPEKLPLATPAKAGLIYEGNGNNGQTTLDLYLPDLPPGAPKPPLIMVVHGGGWVTSADPPKWKLTSSYLVHYGYAVANIQYRLAVAATRTNQFPAAVQDVRCAVHFLRANTGGYAYNPAKLGVLGGSAGGNLVGMLGALPAQDLPKDGFQDTSECAAGTAGKSSGVDAVAAYFPYATVSDKDAVSPNPKGVAAYTGETDYAKMGRAMPVFYLEHFKFPAAPTVIVNGSADTLVKPKQSVDYADALKARGVDVQHFEVEGLPHGFMPFDVARYPSLQPSACAVLDLFKKYLR